jgi:hypothetical protein
MSGQQERWGELNDFDQLDPRDSTLELSGLIDRMQRQARASSGGGENRGRHNNSNIENLTENSLQYGNNVSRAVSHLTDSQTTLPHQRPAGPVPPGPAAADPTRPRYSEFDGPSDDRPPGRNGRHRDDDAQDSLEDRQPRRPSYGDGAGRTIYDQTRGDYELDRARRDQSRRPPGSGTHATPPRDSFEPPDSYRPSHPPPRPYSEPNGQPDAVSQGRHSGASHDGGSHAASAQFESRNPYDVPDPYRFTRSGSHSVPEVHRPGHEPLRAAEPSSAPEAVSSPEPERRSRPGPEPAFEQRIQPRPECRQMPEPPEPEPPEPEPEPEPDREPEAELEPDAGPEPEPKPEPQPANLAIAEPSASEPAASDPTPERSPNPGPAPDPVPVLAAPPAPMSADVAPVQPPPVASFQPTEPPAPWSRADLRQRLERLPFGHPSSPYHVDGERKPPPHRLKHLELAPPTPNRFAASAARALADEPTGAPPVADDEPGFGTPIAAEDAESDQAQDLPAPQSHLDGSWSWGSASLTADQVRVANDAYDRFRSAEGRSLFGGYSADGLTPTLRDVAANLEHGGLAPDTEQTALVDPDTFKARFSDMLRRYPDRTIDRLARRVPGAISYAFVFDSERYSGDIWTVQDALADQGFQMLARRNDWNNAANRCVATMWQDPSHDVPFQVEFHTTASLEAQELARTSANLISDPRIPSADAVHLQADLAAAWAALPAPPGNSEIRNYRRENGGPSPR